MCALVAGEGALQILLPLPLKVMMCALVAGEGEVTLHPEISDTAPLEVSDVRLGG